MRITTVICAIAVVLAVLFFVYAFMVEGFRTTLADAKSRMGQNSDTICMAFGNGSTGDCLKCLDPDGTNHAGTECGYWPQGNACIPRSGIYRLVPDWLTQKQNMDKTYPQTFDPKDFVYNVGKCGGAACASFKSCKSCASAAACGWCDSNDTCMDRSAVSANVKAIADAGSAGSAGSPPAPMCPASGPKGPALNSASMLTPDLSRTVLIQEVGVCRPEVCSDKKSCFECTNTSGCGYCRTTNTCMKVDTAGNVMGGSSGSSGSSICATGQISLQPYMCPCSGIDNCRTCSTQPGCGWCVAGNNCVNMEVSFNSTGTQNVIKGVNIKDCAGGGDGVATSASQCAPGAKLGLVRSESGVYTPTDAELNMAQDNTALSDSGRDVNLQGSGRGVIGAGPVSPATTTPQVTGNGVVTTPTTSQARGGPYKFTNQPDLHTSPFEAYLKVLIKSELAAEGVPLTEPFQNPPNVVKYISNEVGKVIRKNF